MGQPTFAEQTAVPVGRSQEELERLLIRYGATRFARGWDDRRAVISFWLDGRAVRMELRFPNPTDPQFTQTPTGRERTERQAQEAYEQAVRARWRALVAVVKAKLVAVAEGISTIEREFLPDLVLPDGQTFGQWVGPQSEAEYATASLPGLLPGP